MARFLVQRAIIALLVAVTVSIIGFTLLRLSGDLAAALAGDTAKPEQIAQTAHLYGLDRPIIVQYLDWAGKARAVRPDGDRPDRGRHGEDDRHGRPRRHGDLPARKLRPCARVGA